MAHYAACITLRTMAGDPVESLELRMESGRLINERLGNEEEAISDGTIGAVASILTYEANNGDLEAIRAHMLGLKKMVALRGGFRKAKFPPAVQRQIAWSNITFPEQGIVLTNLQG
jgi:hypothetical protein